MPHRRLIAAAIIGALLVQRAEAAEPLQFEAILSLSGPGAFLGTSEREAMELQEKMINRSGGVHGRPISFAFHDDQSSPQVGVQILASIKPTNPPFILGSSLVAACNALAPMVKSGPLLYCLSSGVHPPAGSTMFTASASTTDEARALLAYFRNRGWTRLALMTSTDATGQEADRSFKDLLALPENSSIQLVEHAHFETKDVSISAQLERIQEAHAQALIGWTTGSALGTIMRGMAQMGLNMPLGTTPGNMTYAQMHQFADVLPKELYFGVAAWPVGTDSKIHVDPLVAAKVKDLFSAFAAIGKKPDEGNLDGWDPATLLVDTLRALPEGATAQQVYDYLATREHVPGASGIYNFKAFPQRGLGPNDVIVVRWDPVADDWSVVSGYGGSPLP
jgi:branched-chain amino acid transport system substrate-binding protein